MSRELEATPRGPYRRAWSLLLTSLIAANSTVVAQESKDSPKKSEPALRVLFIGNSLTESNNLPGMVAALARAGGKTPPVVRSIVVGGFSLEDHWDRGEARRAIAGAKWDFVVLQQGPSALEESRQHLIADAKRFAELIRKAGARPALYMVWPATQNADNFDRVCESYRLAAAAVDGLILPAGEAWRAAWRKDAKLPLYSADGLHPTVAGTYAAALVIYQQLYDSSPVGLPSRLTLAPRQTVRVDLKAEQIKALQEAAAEAVAAEAEKAKARPKAPASR